LASSIRKSAAFTALCLESTSGRRCDCADVLQQIAACRGAINSLLVEIIDGEIRFHVLSRNSKVDSREARAAEKLLEILHRYIK
jgi:DNA-binding FrmR family transcriptional regulator